MVTTRTSMRAPGDKIIGNISWLCQAISLSDHDSSGTSACERHHWQVSFCSISHVCMSGFAQSWQFFFATRIPGLARDAAHWGPILLKSCLHCLGLQCVAMYIYTSTCKWIYKLTCQGARPLTLPFVCREYASFVIFVCKRSDGLSCWNVGKKLKLISSGHFGLIQ